MLWEHIKNDIFVLCCPNKHHMIRSSRGLDTLGYCTRQDINVLVMDEISMVDPVFFERCDALLQQFRACPKPFGGLQVVVSGDFLQLPPVKSEKKRLHLKQSIGSVQKFRPFVYKQCTAKRMLQLHLGVMVLYLLSIMLRRTGWVAVPRRSRHPEVLYLLSISATTDMHVMVLY